MNKAQLNRVLWGTYRGSGPAAEIQNQIGLTFGDTLGCGSFGCVLATNDPKWVIKVTTDEKEAAAANAILKKEVKNPALPKVKHVLAISTPKPVWSGGVYGDKAYFVIVRENLDDLPNDLQRHWTHCFDPSRPYHSMRRPASMCTPERLDRLSLKPSKRMDKFVENLRSLVYGESSKMGVESKLADVRAPNLGVRKNGQIVLRDLGTSFIGQAPPFLAGLDLGPKWMKYLALGAVGALLLRHVARQRPGV